MTACPRCRQTVDETDFYCRHCGRSLQPGRGFLFTHAGIIIMALILGPFALPLVWMSKAISPWAKWIYTILLLAVGVYFVVVCYHLYLSIQDAASMMLGGGF